MQSDKIAFRCGCMCLKRKYQQRQCQNDNSIMGRWPTRFFFERSWVDFKIYHSIENSCSSFLVKKMTRWTAIISHEPSVTLNNKQWKTLNLPTYTHYLLAHSVLIIWLHQNIRQTGNKCCGIERQNKKNEDENETSQAANSQHLFATNEKD